MTVGYLDTSIPICTSRIIIFFKRSVHYLLIISSLSSLASARLTLSVCLELQARNITSTKYLFPYLATL